METTTPSERKRWLRTVVWLCAKNQPKRVAGPITVEGPPTKIIGIETGNSTRTFTLIKSRSGAAFVRLPGRRTAQKDNVPSVRNVGIATRETVGNVDGDVDLNWMNEAGEFVDFAKNRLGRRKPIRNYRSAAPNEIDDRVDENRHEIWRRSFRLLRTVVKNE